MAAVYELLPDEEEELLALDLLDDEEEDPEAPEVELDEDDEAFVHDLVLKCLVFMETLTEIQLYPYQKEAAYRIIESVVINDGEEITMLFSRQSGKSETLANVISALMILLPRLAKSIRMLEKFKRGFWVGLFAPTDEQADTVFANIVSKLTSPRAVEMFLDPEIDDRVLKGGTKQATLTLKNCGSLCRRQTCNPKAKIESKSYHFILIDEAQEADDYTVRKSIHPMMAAYNGTIVKTGTPARTKNDFYRAIQHNKRRATRRGAKRCNHFEYNYKTVSKYNPNYAKFIAREKVRLGEDSDEFQMSYNCVAPETLVLTADLRYIPAGTVTPGMRLIGFDEERPGKGMHRNFHESVVTAAKRVMRPSYRMALSDGTSVVSSDGHMWLVLTAGGRTVWKTTVELTQSDRIFKVADVWKEERSYESGYLAAAFEGEGHLSNVRPGQLMCGFSQKDNVMLAQVRKYLEGLGHTTWERTQNSGVTALHISGGRAGVMKFLGQVRPRRLLDKFDVEGLGSIGRHDHAAQEFTHPHIVSLEFLGKREVVALETTTKTFVAEGLASHNCKWMLERGLFVTDDRLEELMDPSMPLVKSWMRTPVVVGIDPARTKDSTVVTVMYVDWNNVDEFGYMEHRILNWLEINNEEWEEQYFRIIEFLAPYRVYAVGVDAQGVGGAVAERIAKLLPNCEVQSLNSDAKSQSERWTHMQALIQRGLFVIPGHSKARRTRVWKRFFQQMTDAEKIYRGPYMLVAAPEEAEAHDDYVDSAALACAMSAIEVMPQVEETSNPMYSRSR